MTAEALLVYFFSWLRCTFSLWLL